ncbi:MAG: 16S rRNA (cytosine(1402)-N(4))-methyltransferase RsmH [Chromatiales bacterium]|jgi:16S rRNA (cytosine1402-N4)-methyltransferase|nr:16S rRNA (cytosine(1402)-N(4))-methyltransferase RsmH [Chromatiales bacterium]
MADAAYTHRPVLLSEAVDALDVRADGIYMDLTYGRGGHAGLIASRLGPRGRLVVMDRDPEAIANAELRFGDDTRVVIERGSFVGFDVAAAALGITGKVNGVLVDLGVSSAQLDDPRRGFSFRQDGPLDMRMDPGTGQSAADWLAQAPESEISRVLWEYGEEKHARRMARAIVGERAVRPFLTTMHLQEVIARANPAWEQGKDPATRAFQAIRIHINGELEALGVFLDRIIDVLAPGGRLVVISFHSLEDRMVKRFIRKQARGDDLPPDLPVPDSARRPRLRAIGAAMQPSQEEVQANPRARSAVLRVAERLQ